MDKIMNNKSITEENNPKNGSLLVTVMGVLVVLSAVIGSLLTLSINHFRNTQFKIDAEQAFYLAEAGIEAGAIYFQDNSNYLPDTYTNTINTSTGGFTYRIEKSDHRTCDIIATGYANDRQRTIKLTGVRAATYAEFAFFAEDNKSIYFKSGEKFYGHIHTGTAPWFSGNPEFNDEFSTKAKSYKGNINNVTFRNGFNTDKEVASISDVDFDGMKSFASSNNKGLALIGPTTIAFENNNILVTNSDKNWNRKTINLSDLEIIYIKKDTARNEDGDLILEGGTLDGELSIVTEQDIYINNHLKYEMGDLTEEEFLRKAEEGSVQTTSKLGLISGDDVIITQNAPNDIHIHASIMATGKMSADTGSFLVDIANNAGSRGAIHLIGGIIQDVRGAVGYFNANTGITSAGYEKHYIFDRRFSTQPPPYFPAINSKLTYETWTEM